MEFLGSGWAFPVSAARDQENEGIAITEGERKIRDSIWIILATAPGERMMRPDFGCGIHELVFAPNDSGTAERVRTSVRDSLIHWEPRIDVLDVTVTARARGAVLLINVHYLIRSTNNRFNLVFPFYLDRSEL